MQRFDLWIENNVFSHVISDLTIENRVHTIDFMRTRLRKQTFLDDVNWNLT